jgi:hypothetical protein
MKKARFTEEQIIGFLCEQESGVTTAEVCRRHGFSEATFYKWKSKYGGLEVSPNRLAAICTLWRYGACGLGKGFFCAVQRGPYRCRPEHLLG